MPTSGDSAAAASLSGPPSPTQKAALPQPWARPRRPRRGCRLRRLRCRRHLVQPRRLLPRHLPRPPLRRPPRPRRPCKLETRVSHGLPSPCDNFLRGLHAGLSPPRDPVSRRLPLGGAHVRRTRAAVLVVFERERRLRGHLDSELELTCGADSAFPGDSSSAFPATDNESEDEDPKELEVEAITKQVSCFIGLLDYYPCSSTLPSPPARAARPRRVTARRTASTARSLHLDSRLHLFRWLQFLIIYQCD